jgi:hypothetical protein
MKIITILLLPYSDTDFNGPAGASWSRLKGEWVLNVDSALAAYRFEYDFSS